MGEDAVTVVEISLDPVGALGAAQPVVGWLLGTGVVEVNERRDPFRQPSAYAPGPAVREAAPGWCAADGRLLNNGVDVLVERALYHPTQAYYPPACPRCEGELDEAAHHAYLKPWLDGPEPRPACPHCGARTPLGDWLATYQVGELAVRFNNWPVLDEAFLGELYQRLGPRCRTVYEQY